MSDFRRWFHGTFYIHIAVGYVLSYFYEIVVVRIPNITSVFYIIVEQCILLFFTKKLQSDIKLSI